MTPIQRRTDDLNWMSLEGKTLNDSYVLGQCLGADEHKVLFKAQVIAGEPNAAVVRIYRATSDVADEQLALWESIQQLRHPNLMAILGAGRTQLGGQDLIYVAVEAADEKLDGILRERPLDTTEARELATSMCRGLQRLHEAGLVHGSISPQHVFGVADAIKLSTHGAHRAGPANTSIAGEESKYVAPESANGNSTPEADIWCLGAALYEAMTQKACAADCHSEAMKLPSPFGTIVHRCLHSSPDARCTLSDVLQLCERRPHAFAAAAGAGADVVAETGHKKGVASRDHDIDESRYFVPRSVPAAEQEVRQFARRAAATRKIQWRTWLFLAVALLVVVALIWMARPRKSAASATVPRIGKSTVSQLPATPAQKATTSTASPAAPSSAPNVASAPPGNAARERTALAGKQAQFVNGPIWRVVTYTYDSSRDAENRASAINNRHPDLKAGVFAPNGDAGPYLVVIGGEMSRESAVTLREKALRLGLPHDSYVQNYKQ